MYWCVHPICLKSFKLLSNSVVCRQIQVTKICCCSRTPRIPTGSPRNPQMRSLCDKWPNSRCAGPLLLPVQGFPMLCVFPSQGPGQCPLHHMVQAHPTSWDQCGTVGPNHRRQHPQQLSNLCLQWHCKSWLTDIIILTWNAINNFIMQR